MPKLSQAARGVVTKITADLNDRVNHAEEVRSAAVRRADDLQIRLSDLGARASAAQKRITELRKLLLAAEVKIGRLEGRLQTVNEVQAREDTPVTTTTQVAKSPLLTGSSDFLRSYHGGAEPAERH